MCLQKKSICCGKTYATGTSHVINGCCSVNMKLQQQDAKNTYIMLNIFQCFQTSQSVSCLLSIGKTLNVLLCGRSNVYI